MKPPFYILVSCLSLLTLTACGAEADDPAQQIVVRDPGEPAKAAADMPGDMPGDTSALIASGKAAFAVCSACHSAEKGAASAIGPNLYGVVGRAAGTASGYKYSPAMTASGITWTESELDRFITNPATAVPGTRMSAGAISNPERRAAVIAYLASL